MRELFAVPHPPQKPKAQANRPPPTRASIPRKSTMLTMRRAGPPNTPSAEDMSAPSTSASASWNPSATPPLNKIPATCSVTGCSIQPPQQRYEQWTSLLRAPSPRLQRPPVSGLLTGCLQFPMTTTFFFLLAEAAASAPGSTTPTTGYMRPRNNSIQRQRRRRVAGNHQHLGLRALQGNAPPQPHTAPRSPPT